MPGRFVDGEWTEGSDSSACVVHSFTYQRITDVNRNQANVGDPRASLFRELLTSHRERSHHGPPAESNGQADISPIQEEPAEMSDDEDVGREKNPEESEADSNLWLSSDRGESVDGNEVSSEEDSVEMSAGAMPEAVAELREDNNNGSSDEEPNESDVSTVELRRNKRARAEDTQVDSDMEVEGDTDGEIPAEIDPNLDEESGDNTGSEAEGNEGDEDNDEESEGNAADDSSYEMSSPPNNSIVLSLRPRCTDHDTNNEIRPSCVNYWMEKLRQSENSGERKRIAAAVKTASYCAEKHAKIRKMEAQIDMLKAQSRLEQAKTQLLQEKIERHRRRHPRPLIPE